MSTLYLDIFSGISGDMFLGALIDLGLDPEILGGELSKLELSGYHLHVTRGQKASIAGVKFDVHVGDHDHDSRAHRHGTRDYPHAHGHEHSHSDQGPHGGPLAKLSKSLVELSVFETNVPPRFRLYFTDHKGKTVPLPPEQSILLETIRPGGARQVFKFKRRKGYLEATHELPEPHEFTAVLKAKSGGRSEQCRLEFIEHHHHHEHAHDGHGHHQHPHSAEHHHSYEHSAPHQHGRTFAEIRHLIQSSALSSWVQKKSLAVFERIAIAEGRIHGMSPEKVHFHEVGAIDSIIDIVGACVALEKLGKPRVLASHVVEGSGFIQCAHGRFPIPAPATLAILGARGIPISQCDEPHELVTPTGAALLAEFVEQFGPMQSLVAQRIGFGLGTRDNQTRPNVLRAVLGESVAPPSAHDWETDRIIVLEANVDDVSAEILGHFVEKAFASGALDVFYTPIQMKKNRPGVLLSVLCAEPDADSFTELMLRETSTFGVRRSTLERRKLAREFLTVKTPFGEVVVKIGRLDGKVIQVAPEFESCKAAAEKSKTTLKQVYDAATRSLKIKGYG
jgi:uncharacterized protein (TIGR00299 family) protein